MKFEQALKAMRRGEKVRCRCWDRGVCMWMRDGRIDASRAEKPGFTQDANLIRDDWVIVRKKPKAPAPRYTEDQLEPVGTEARVGDIIVAMEDKAYGIELARRGDLFDYASNGRIDSRRSFGSPERSNGWFFHKDEPSLRILKRPAKPLRDVFADPRVGDVIGDINHLWRVIGVGGGQVAYQCTQSYGGPADDIFLETRGGFKSLNSWTITKLTIVSRAPEVAPTA